MCVGRPYWFAFFFIGLFIVALMPVMVFADGGTLQASVRAGARRISVFTTPSVLRAGPVDISVLVQDAESGSVAEAPTVDVELTSAESPMITLAEAATSRAATNKLFQSVVFNVPHEGHWHARVFLDALNSPEPACEFDLWFNPPPPPWLELAPWIGWPLGAIALFCLHQWRASKIRHRTGQPDLSIAERQLQMNRPHVS